MQQQQPPSTMSKQYQVAIVGAGVMGQRMLAVLEQHSRFTPVAFYEPGTTADIVMQDSGRALRRADSLQDLFNTRGLDLLYIASPPAAHLDAVHAAVAAGIPCLCEKPLANTVASALAIHAQVSASGLPFAVNFPFARAEGPGKLMDLVATDALGDITSARLRVRFARWPRAWQAGATSWLEGPSEGGFTREVLSHFIFLAHRLFGPSQVEVDEIVRGAKGTETLLKARLRHANVTTEIDCAVEGDIVDDNRFEVTGTAGSAVLTEWFKLRHGGTTYGPGQASVRTLDAAARLLEGDASSRLATASEALEVVQRVEALLASQGR